MSQDGLLVQVKDKRVLTVDCEPSSVNRLLPDPENPFDISPQCIRVWTAIDLFFRQYLEIETRTSRRRKDGVASLRWRFAQQGTNHCGSSAAIVHDRQVDTPGKSFDGRSDRHDDDHCHENDCRKLPTHRLRQAAADEIPHTSSTVAVKM
ncbi:hypothetical protein [Mesorhizobium sp. AR07]|uniref:hypothetical protein n=1 Tax=Mesorhizobium sp. AR07 TaxID=2865838 RepID=UPI002160DEC3|nr:hypothetical protein [Mesorhizobium sp. AR07]